MATRKDHQDRGGKSTEMIKRTVRLTKDENDKLNEILKVSNSTLRDAISDMIEKRYIEVTLQDAKKILQTLNDKINTTLSSEKIKEKEDVANESIANFRQKVQKLNLEYDEKYNLLVKKLLRKL